MLFLVIYVTLSHSSPKYIQECQVLDSQQYNAALHVPDYSIIVEADGNESGKKQLKTMTWPVMDDDAFTKQLHHKGINMSEQMVCENGFFA